jgi:hypothetical protein
MASPLNKDERYVLAYLRSDRVAASYWGWLAAKLLIAVMFAVGFVNDNRALIFTAFGALLLLDLYSAAKQPRFTKSICLAVAKLESRIEELETAHRPAI